MQSPGVCSNIIDARHKKEGYGSVDNPRRFLNQDYRQLKHLYLSKQARYLDEMFPPDKMSIGQGLLDKSILDQVVWKRPWKINPNPCFVLDGFSRFDFAQGVVGNCWFLASIGALTFRPSILQQVVPQDQVFDQDYCGMFHFRFWRFGSWVDVVIDDKLPTINGNLIFVHSKDQAEFWPALLEKAYAKVCGSYADMNAGTPVEAMVDFTGGVHMCIQLKTPPPNLWELMYRAGTSTSLMSSGTEKDETSKYGVSVNNVLPNGLVEGHAYTVTGVKQLMSQGRRECLVRLWNPWGQVEWKGGWSDESPLWQTVSPEDRNMCLEVKDNGEFWMSLKDFCQFFNDLDICALCPDFLDGSSSCHWRTSFYEGRWVAGISAGGCPQHPDSFWTNPQYRIKVGELNSECSQGENNLLVSLMQKPDKRNRRLVKNLNIGITVFKVTDEYQNQQGKFEAGFFSGTRLAGQTETYYNAREVMVFLKLKPGEYVIVPSTFTSNKTASFILTILSKVETHVHENSAHHHPQPTSPLEPKDIQNAMDSESKRNIFHQYSDEAEEVGAEQLQKILNEEVFKDDLKSGGFSIDACRSLVALMDTDVTGKLNTAEFVRLWNRVVIYKDIFSRSDVSKTGTLSLTELRNAVANSGMRVSDDMLNLMAMRYGTSSGHITLESFITLALRYSCMRQIFRQLSDGTVMSLHEREWLYLSVYT